jgi:hypothetical protein
MQAVEEALNISDAGARDALAAAWPHGSDCAKVPIAEFADHQMIAVTDGWASSWKLNFVRSARPAVSLLSAALDRLRQSVSSADLRALLVVAGRVPAWHMSTLTSRLVRAWVRPCRH